MLHTGLGEPTASSPHSLLLVEIRECPQSQIEDTKGLEYSYPPTGVLARQRPSGDGAAGAAGSGRCDFCPLFLKKWERNLNHSLSVFSQKKT